MTSGVTIGGVLKPGKPFLLGGDTARVMEPTGDTVSMTDTMLVAFTDSVVLGDQRLMRLAKARDRGMDGGWVDVEGGLAWETVDDSLVIVNEGYGYYFRSSHPLVPIAAAGSFRSGTHMGVRSEGTAWLLPRVCSDAHHQGD